MASSLVLMLVSLLLGLGAGVILHRADFCMVAALRDLLLFRSTTLLTALFCLIAASALLFEIARLSGLLVQYPFPLLTPPSATHLFGGMLFGLGMVLAGGCVVGILYKLGSGALLYLWGLGGMILGSALYAELFPLLGDWPLKTRLTSTATLPQLLGWPPGVFVALLSVLALAILRRQRDCFQRGDVHQTMAYLPPCRAALLLALIGLVSAVTLGMPLGVTTTYAKWAAHLEYFFFPQHVANLVFFQQQPLHLALPLVAQPLHGGPGPAFDGMAVIQYPLVAGIVFGSGFSALHLGEWRLQGGAPLRQKLWVLCGGVLIGVASRVAGGCNIWHLWGGLPVFSLSSLLFLAGLWPGVWLGGKILMHWILPARDMEKSHERNAR